jgi:S1-C subfamily serine protease
MDDIKILEAVEKYINGEMRPDERVYFENLRKSSPEIDQLVVEHTFFLQQMNRFDETKKLKNILNDVHISLAEKGAIKFPKLKGKAKVVYLVNKYKRVGAIAASIAGLTVLTMSALIWSLSPVKPANKSDIDKLSRDIRNIDKKVNQVSSQNRALNKKIDNVADQTGSTEPEVRYISGGTGFLIDAKGYVLTNAHVVQNASHIAVQNNNGSDLNATVVYMDVHRDLAILKIADKKFKAPSSIPYSIKKTGGEISESIYTLGYPRNDIVYGEGYLAAKTGFNGDTLTCQIAIPANRGNSGSPIFNRYGEIIGILSGKQTSAEGAVFALQSKYIFSALTELKKQDTTYKNIKLPTSSSVRGNDRTQQVKKISDFVYIVKVD